jgi:hypothetical protein
VLDASVGDFERRFVPAPGPNGVTVLDFGMARKVIPWTSEKSIVAGSAVGVRVRWSEGDAGSGRLLNMGEG